MIPHAGTPWISDNHDRLRRLDANCDLWVEPRDADLIHLHVSPANLSRIRTVPTLLRKHATKKIPERHPSCHRDCENPTLSRIGIIAHRRRKRQFRPASRKLAMKSAGNGSGLLRDQARDHPSPPRFALTRRRRDLARGGNRLLSRDRSRQSSAQRRRRDTGDSSNSSNQGIDQCSRETVAS